MQFTAPNRERHIANRELGTIEKIDDSGNLQLRLDSGRDGRIQHQRESASRLRLCGDEPQQPGTNRRPRARACGHRAGRRKTRESPLGVCGGVAWTLRCANLHERQEPSCRATLARRVAPIRDGTEPSNPCQPTKSSDRSTAQARAMKIRRQRVTASADKCRFPPLSPPSRGKPADAAPDGRP